MEPTAPLDIEAELRTIAHTLARLTPEAVDQAEIALRRVIDFVQRGPGALAAPFAWPARELALCRQMVVTSNQFWERRRSMVDNSTGAVSSRRWIG